MDDNTEKRFCIRFRHISRLEDNMPLAYIPLQGTVIIANSEQEARQAFFDKYESNGSRLQIIETYEVEQ